MIIIQEGKVPKQYLKFNCHYCGAVFAADSEEYTVRHDITSNEDFGMAECPYCKCWLFSNESYEPPEAPASSDETGGDETTADDNTDSTGEGE